jgi:hypothetical protein
MLHIRHLEPVAVGFATSTFVVDESGEAMVYEGESF